ncbi:hypothetical protein PG991_011557 [Apiospora marii]|uniref:Uncharacterized protein n=1 Tax=Apiospora marii TaxID=335849 RepID=A0ABR1REL3_9PEZI
MAQLKKVASLAAVNPTDNPNQLKTTSEIVADAILGYKIRVLIYDLRNISKDTHSQRRTLQTTDELYISSPYFTPKEASIVKRATCVLEEEHQSPKPPESVETAIQKAMTNFFEKRKASGDARPCGPHDLAPIYEAVFGIEKEEVQDERFLSRMRRQGLPPIEDEPKPAVASGSVDSKKKHKKK